MTIIEAIQSRHSVRRYTDKPIEDELLATLREKVEEINKLGNLHVQLITNEPTACSGKMAYGSFNGVKNYFAMIGQKSDGLQERVGYYGEQLVLLAETLGLNTCWVGLTYNKVKDHYVVGNDEKLCCLITVGYGNDEGRHTKKKAANQLSNLSDTTPQWFKAGMEAAALAPTAVNQQKFKFEYVAPQGGAKVYSKGQSGSDGNGLSDSKVEGQGKAKVKTSEGTSLLGYTKIDLGIAKCHFEIGAGKDNFDWA